MAGGNLSWKGDTTPNRWTFLTALRQGFPFFQIYAHGREPPPLITFGTFTIRITSDFNDFGHRSLLASHWGLAAFVFRHVVRGVVLSEDHPPGLCTTRHQGQLDGKSGSEGHQYLGNGIGWHRAGPSRIGYRLRIRPLIDA